MLIASSHFKFWPGREFDLWTFEIKPSWDVGVTGVFEAAAHARASTHSYVLFQVEADGDQETDHIARINSEAQRFGVGLVFFSDPADFSKWNFVVDPARHKPDPSLLDGFVATQLSEEAREKLLKWQK